MFMLKLMQKKQLNNVKLYGDLDFRYHFNENDINFTDYLTEEGDVFKTYICGGKVAVHHLYQGYRLGALYSKDNFELDSNLFVQHVFKDEINGNNKKKKMKKVNQLVIRIVMS